MRAKRLFSLLYLYVHRILDGGKIHGPYTDQCAIYLTFPLCIKNFMCHVNFLSLGHLTVPESVRKYMSYSK